MSTFTLILLGLATVSFLWGIYQAFQYSFFWAISMMIAPIFIALSIFYATTGGGSESTLIFLGAGSAFGLMLAFMFVFFHDGMICAPFIFAILLGVIGVFGQISSLLDTPEGRFILNSVQQEFERRKMNREHQQEHQPPQEPQFEELPSMPVPTPDVFPEQVTGEGQFNLEEYDSFPQTTPEMKQAFNNNTSTSPSPSPAFEEEIIIPKLYKVIGASELQENINEYIGKSMDIKLSDGVERSGQFLRLKGKNMVLQKRYSGGMIQLNVPIRKIHTITIRDDVNYGGIVPRNN